MQAPNPDKREPQGITLAHHTTCCLALLHYSSLYTALNCTGYIVLYSVQCTVYSVQCTVYSVQCSVYSLHCSPPALCQKQQGAGGTLLYYSLQEFNEIPTFLHEEVKELQLEQNRS